MKRKSFLLMMSIILVLSMFIAACSSKDAGSGEGKGEGNPEYGGHVTLSMFSAPKGLFNIIFYEDQYDNYVLNYTTESLWAYDDKMQLTVPLLAEKWELSDDGKVVTITLRKDAKWSDGEPITTDDFIFTWETIASKEYTTEAKAPRYYAVEQIKGAAEMHEGKADSLSGVKKIDDHTMEVEFTEATANALDNLWPSPIPKHVFDGMSVVEMKNSGASKNAGEIVTSGAFKFKEAKKNEYVILEKNPHYHVEGRPYLDEIHLKVMTQDVAMGALKNEQIDFLGQINPAEFDTIKKMDHVTIKETQDLAYQYLGFKVKNPKLSNKKLRQAISYGINRKAMVDGLLRGHGTVLNQHMPDASWAANEKLKDAYPYDPEKAKQILEEAGYKDVDGDGFVEDPDGKKLEISLDYPTGNPVRERSAILIGEDLKKIGLNIKVKSPRDFESHSDAVQKDKVEMWLMGWSLVPDPDPSGIWGSKDNWNFPRWENKKSDELIQKARLELDREKAKEIYAEWTELVAEEAPYVFLFSENKIEAWNNRVKGVTFDWRGAIEHYKFTEWWIPKDQQ